LFVSSKLAKIEKKSQGSNHFKIESSKQLSHIKTKQIKDKNTSFLPKLRTRIKPTFFLNETSNVNVNSFAMNEKGKFFNYSRKIWLKI
jgi:hypothetical protein